MRKNSATPSDRYVNRQSGPVKANQLSLEKTPEVGRRLSAGDQDFLQWSSIHLIV